MDITLDNIKGIRLYQKRKGYRFTIDSLLLADYVERIKPHNIADVGAGNGIIGILLAKKYPDAKVTLIEIQKGLYDLCKKNILLNKLPERVTACNCDISEIEKPLHIPPQSFDVVVSNPPFRKPKTGKISSYDEKAIARHEIKMNLSKLMHGIDYLLKPKGYMYLIFHPFRIVELFDTMRKARIEPKRIRFIHPNYDSEAKMILIEGVKAARASVRIEKPLFIYNKEKEYSGEVRDILR